MSTEEKILEILHKYVTGKYSTEEFRKNYLQLWRNLRDSGGLEGEQKQVQRGIDIVFSAVESFDTDIEDSREMAQQEAVLLAEVRVVLSMLSA